MIQRIQTIYLLLAAILMAVTAFSPILMVDGGLTVFSYGIKEAEELIKPTWGIVTMAGLSAVLSFVAVFLYKNRSKQKNVALLSVFVIVLYYITAVVYMVSYFENFFAIVTSFVYGIICLPIIAMLFLLLAMKGINKDDKLVKSLNRIR